MARIYKRFFAHILYSLYLLNLFEYPHQTLATFVFPKEVNTEQI